MTVSPAAALREAIVEAWARLEAGAGDQQVDVIIPDSPYSAAPFSLGEVSDAVKGLPHFYAFGRASATAAVPFDGWRFTFRKRAA